MTIVLDDQMDAKSLTGAYVCTAVPGEFVWQPGPITQVPLQHTHLQPSSLTTLSAEGKIQGGNSMDIGMRNSTVRKPSMRITSGNKSKIAWVNFGLLPLAAGSDRWEVVAGGGPGCGAARGDGLSGAPPGEPPPAPQPPRPDHRGRPRLPVPRNHHHSPRCSLVLRHCYPVITFGVAVAGGRIDSRHF